MGLLDKIKGGGRGVVSAVEPEQGVDVQPADEVRRRLLAITGKGIQTAEQDGEIIVSWSAKVKGAGPLGVGSQHVYRAISVSLDGASHEAKARCQKKTMKAEAGFTGRLSGAGNWARGPQMGSETFHVVAWLGPHETEGGADERGYKFSWADLRDPVIDAVTGAGWTYKPSF